MTCQRGRTRQTVSAEWQGRVGRVLGGKTGEACHSLEWAAMTAVDWSGVPSLFLVGRALRGAYAPCHGWRLLAYTKTQAARHRMQDAGGCGRGGRGKTRPCFCLARVSCVVCRVVSCRVSRVVWALSLCASTIHVHCFFLRAPLRRLPAIGTWLVSPRASRVVTLDMFCFPQAFGPVTLSRAQARVAIWALAGWPLGVSLGWANQGSCSRVTVPPPVETCSADHAPPPPSLCVYAGWLCSAQEHTQRRGTKALIVPWSWAPCHGRLVRASRAQVGPSLASRGLEGGRVTRLEDTKASRFSTYLRMLISRLTVDPARRTHYLPT
jgi:hypothetical protein